MNGGMPEAVSPAFAGMNRLTLHFADREAEARYQASSADSRKLQMRLALLFVGVLYCMISVLDQSLMPASVRHFASVMHLSQGLWLCLSALVLFRAHSQGLHALAVIVLVFIAWNLNLAISTIGRTDMLFGETYLMLFWVWMISGLRLSQAATVNLVFIAIFEAVVLIHAPYSPSQLLDHQFFIFCSVVLGALGAYLTEFYKRQRFIGQEQLSAHASALADANQQLARDRKALVKLSQAVEQSGEAVLITDRHAVIEYANPTFTQMSGRRPEEVAGTVPDILDHEAGDASEAGEMWAALARGEVWSGMSTGHKADGSVYPALVSVAPIHDDDTLAHYVVTQKDMTEYQRLEEQLRQAQKMEAIGTLVGGIAHDFNNTLAGITGNTYLARQAKSLPPQTMDILERIEALAFRSADIVKQLLAFSRKGIVHMQEISLAEFLAEAAKLYAAALPENIQFRRIYEDPEHMAIHGDANQLEQALFNLLNNARDAMAEAKNPQITLTLQQYTPDAAFRESHPLIQGDALACISISDNGCGMSAETMAHIFEPFYTTKGVHEGTGLGLSMVYGMAQSHGGGVTVESRLGKGSSFHLYLPLLGGDSKPVASEPEEEASRGHGTVLLADDNQAVLNIVKAVLEGLGYEVMLAMDGAHAVRIYREHHADICLTILDVVMPKMGGIEASKAIRAVDSEAKIIFMTGYDPSQQFNTADMATEKVVLKPFKVGAFSQLVKSVLER